MNRTIMVSLALFAFAACSKDSKDSSSGSSAAKAAPGSAAAPASAAPAAPAGGGPVKTDPKALFAEFSDKNTGDPMALLDKYKDGATFSGKIITAPGDMAPTSAVMDVDGTNHIMMDFTDATSVKGMKSGDTITATCQIGGEVGAMMQVTDCALVK